MQENFHFSTSSPAFIVWQLFWWWPSDWCEAIPHCRFLFFLFFTSLIVILSIFSCVYWPSVCLLQRNVYLGPLPIFNFFLFFLLSCMSYLCILEINPLSVASFASIFSHFEDCLFVLFMVSFAVHKRLSLIRSHLFVFVFIFITLGGGSKRILLWFMSKCSAYVFRVL